MQVGIYTPYVRSSEVTEAALRLAKGLIRLGVAVDLRAPKGIQEVEPYGWDQNVRRMDNTRQAVAWAEKCDVCIWFRDAPKLVEAIQLDQMAPNIFVALRSEVPAMYEQMAVYDRVVFACPVKCNELAGFFEGEDPVALQWDAQPMLMSRPEQRTYDQQQLLIRFGRDTLRHDHRWAVELGQYLHEMAPEWSLVFQLDRTIPRRAKKQLSQCGQVHVRPTLCEHVRLLTDSHMYFLASLEPDTAASLAVARQLRTVPIAFDVRPSRFQIDPGSDGILLDDPNENGNVDLAQTAHEVLYCMKERPDFWAHMTVDRRSDEELDEFDKLWWHLLWRVQN